MEFTDESNITMAVLLEASRGPHLVRNLTRGGYALAFALYKYQDKKEDFNIGLGYVGVYRQRLDLDISPATTREAWHIRLMADGTKVLFEHDITYDKADGEHPCLIRF